MEYIVGTWTTNKVEAQRLSLTFQIGHGRACSRISKSYYMQRVSSSSHQELAVDASCCHDLWDFELMQRDPNFIPLFSKFRTSKQVAHFLDETKAASSASQPRLRMVVKDRTCFPNDRRPQRPSQSEILISSSGDRGDTRIEICCITRGDRKKKWVKPERRTTPRCPPPRSLALFKLRHAHLRQSSLSKERSSMDEFMSPPCSHLRENNLKPECSALRFVDFVVRDAKPCAVQRTTEWTNQWLHAHDSAPLRG